MVSLALTLAALFVAIQPANAAMETNREIARIYATFEIKHHRYESAATSLKKHVEEDAADYSAWNLLGLVQLMKGDPAGAQSSFQTATQTPDAADRLAYLYNYADALARDSKIDQARTALQEAARDERARDSAERALENLHPGQALEPFWLSEPGHWNASFSLKTAYDTNVLLVSDAALSGGSATRTASFLIEPSGSLAYSRELRNSVFSSGISSTFDAYVKEEARTFNSLSNSWSTSWLQARDADSGLFHGIGNTFSLSYLNNRSFHFYNASDLPYYRLTWAHSSIDETELTLAGGYQKYSVQSGDDPDNDRSGALFKPELDYHRSFGSLQLTVGAGMTRLFAKGKNYSGTAIQAPINLTANQLFWDFVGVLKAQPSYTTYPDSSAHRKDQAILLSASLFHQLIKGMYLSIDYEYLRNFSNVESYRYVKHQIGASVTYALF